MRLPPGARLGPYEVVSPLGAGGMGEVYRARDTKLDREVALKVLPDLFALDGARLERFRREAQILASLNHPNIAAIYGLDDTDGQLALVLELVEGPTLADRLARAPLPLSELLLAATQVVDGLEAAHEQGIIHRDLKPANVKVRPDGTLKILDFGLARVLEPRGNTGDMAATVPLGLTIEGTIVGTAAYMSPEQATGGVVDKRTDIWAFGVVLYEMLVGRSPFAADSASATIARILEGQPDWSALPARTPPALRRLVTRCLEKDVRRRLRDIGDARLELNDALAIGATDQANPSAGSRRVAPLAWAAALGVGGFLIGVALTRTQPAAPIAPPGASVEIGLPRGQSPMFLANPVAISPDGRHIVVATSSQLYLRPIDSLAGVSMPGTLGARSPFFSPDGEWIAYWANGQIRKISVHGGVPITLCRAQNLYGATWSEDGDRILYGQGPRGIYEVSGNGSEPRAVIQPDPAKGELSFQGPQRLPNSGAILFTQLDAGKNWKSARVMVQDGDERRTLVEGASDARYVPSGHLVFTREQALHAVAFDPRTRQLTGTPVPVIENVRRAQLWETGAAQFSFSQTGTLLYVPAGRDVERRLVWVDRQGVEEELPMPLRFYVHPRLSPDGQQIVVDTVDTLDLWIYQLDRGTLRRLTVEQTNLHPVWSADGRRVIYDTTQGAGLHWSDVDGNAVELILRDSSRLLTAVSVSRDGRFLAFERSEDWVSFDIAILPLFGPREPQTFLATAFKETSPVFSPDGEWLAYVSDETGREEVYVQPFPGPGRKTLISTSGGREPQWSPAGGELFYRMGTALMAVRVGTRPHFSAGTPERLFQRAYGAEPIGAHPTYDVSPDGKRFLFVKDMSAVELGNRLHLVFGWFHALKQHAVPAR